MLDVFKCFLKYKVYFSQGTVFPLATFLSSKDQWLWCVVDTCIACLNNGSRVLSPHLPTARKCLNLIIALKNLGTNLLVLTFTKTTAQQGQSHIPVGFYTDLLGLAVIKGVLVLIKCIYRKRINGKGAGLLTDNANNKGESRKWRCRRSLQSAEQLA